MISSYTYLCISISFHVTDMSQSTMQFDHQGSFIKVERAPGDLLQVELQFRTLKPDVVLVYSETLSESDAQTGYIQVFY